MFAFTRQEQRFLLLLMAAFFVGLAVKYYRHNHDAQQPDTRWAVERDKIIEEFRQSAQKSADVKELKTEQYDAISKETITGKININNASLQELQTLPRIGPATAKKIVDFRNEYGPFEKIQDIQKVKSIGPKTFTKIKEYITVD